LFYHQAARHHRVLSYPPLQLRSSAYLHSSDTHNQSAKQQNFSIAHREPSVLAEVLILLNVEIATVQPKSLLPEKGGIFSSGEFPISVVH
jgi:hypothetical protein